MAGKKELSFAVFVIRALADAGHRPTPDVYCALERYGALDKYLIPFYDVLHTCGREYLVDDITGYLRDRGRRP